MRSSIKIKMFIVFSIFVLLIIFSLWILNFYFVDEYYLFKKKNDIIEEIKNIDLKYDGDIDNIATELNDAQNVFGGNFIIFDGDTGEVKYTSFFGPMMGMKRSNQISNGNNTRNSLYRIGINEQILSTISKEFKINETTNAMGDSHIIMTGIFKNNDPVVFISPVDVISEHIKVTSDFYVYIGIIIIVIGLIAAYFIANTITKPVLVLTKKARQMLNLDFSNNYEVNSNDEIGQLSKVMCNLSEKLDDALKDLYNVNETLKEDINKEKELEEARREFISNVSHELKTPIALIQGYSEGLKDNIVKDEESMNFYTEVIWEEAIKMDKLVKTLMELSKTEIGKNNIKIEKVNLSEIIIQNIKKFQTFAQNSNINIDLDAEEKEYIVKADKEKIEQVINNLLSNAVRYTEGKEKKVKVTIKNKAKNKVEIRIFNTCGALSDKELIKIWDRFYKVDKSRNRIEGGTGLGLAIVKNILKIHESNFGVVNVEGGIEFFLDLDKM